MRAVFERLLAIPTATNAQTMLAIRAAVTCVVISRPNPYFSSEIPAARVPRRKADECVYQRQGNGKGHRLAHGDLSGDGKQVSQHPRDRNPGEKVKAEPPKMGEYRVHAIGLVLDDDAAHEIDSFYN